MSSQINSATIRNRRLTLGLSQRGLAEIAGRTSSVTVWSVERRKHTPRPETLAKLSRAMDEAALRNATAFKPASIRPKRSALKLTCKALAEHAGISPITLGRIERMKCVPKRKTLAVIQAALDEAIRDQATRFDFRKARLERSLGLVELSELAGISTNALLGIEKGRTNPMPNTIAKLRAALDVKGSFTGPQVKAQRLSFRLTQRELAERARVDVGTLLRFENGVRIVKPSTATKLKAALRTVESEPCEYHDLSSGPAIRRQRIAAGVSAKKFAERVGIDRTAVRLIELNKVQARPKTLRAIERVLSEAEKGRLTSNPRGSRLYPGQCRSTNGRVPAKVQTKRTGRPQDTNPSDDKRIFDAWSTGQYLRYADLARELRITTRAVREAIDRHRHRIRAAGAPE